MEYRQNDLAIIHRSSKCDLADMIGL